MLVAALVLTLAAQPPAAAAPPPAPAGPTAARFGPKSTFKEMAADPRARAILVRHIPLIMQVFDAGMFQDTSTLEQVSQAPSAQDQGGFTEDAYNAILADFAKL